MLLGRHKIWERKPAAGREACLFVAFGVGVWGVYVETEDHSFIIPRCIFCVRR